MAINDSRSMNADLQEGLLDGRVKTLSPDRGGTVEVQNVHERALALQAQYSISDHMHSFAMGCQCAQCA